MSSKFETVSINVTPPTLQVHAGEVGVTIDASFPEKYFTKTSTIEFTPVLIHENGEQFREKRLQEERLLFFIQLVENSLTKTKSAMMKVCLTQGLNYELLEKQKTKS